MPRRYPPRVPILGKLLPRIRHPDDLRHLKSEKYPVESITCGVFYRTLVRSCEEALRENRGPLYLLHQIAEGYFGLVAEAKGRDPLARLGSLFEDDERLVEAALIALRGAVDRGDVPEADEIIGLRREGQEHRLALPFRAALAERARGIQGAVLDFDCRQMEIALAFRYCTVTFTHCDCDCDWGWGWPRGYPAWYQRLLEVKPGLVANVMIRCAKSVLRGGQTEALSVCTSSYAAELVRPWRELRAWASCVPFRYVVRLAR